MLGRILFLPLFLSLSTLFNMPDYPPPLRVFSTGALSVSPVYEIEVTSGPLVRTGPTRVQLGWGGGGGSGTVNAGSSGYIAYYPSAGMTVDDATILFWDNVSYRLGIGTNSPLTKLHIVEPDENGDNASSINVDLYSTTNFPEILLRNAWGTLSAPARVQTGEIGRWSIYAHNGINFRELSTVYAYFPSYLTTTSSSIPTSTVIETCGINSMTATNVFEFGHNNNFGIGTNVDSISTWPTYDISFYATTDKSIGIERSFLSTSVGKKLTVLAGGCSSGSTNINGGDLILKSGVSTGNGSSGIIFQTVAPGQGSGTTDRNPSTLVTMFNIFDVVGTARTQSVHVLGVQATSAGHAVRADRIITTLFPLTGGGLDFTADRTFSVNTAFLVTSARSISVAGGALSGGGNLSADRTITLGTPIAVGSGGTGIVGIGSATTLLGSNSSAAVLGYYSVVGSANAGVVFTANTLNILANPDYEEVAIFAALTAVWLNMPAAPTEFFAGTWARALFNCTFVSSCRLIANMAVAGTANSFLFAQVSTDGGTTWASLGATGTTSPACRVDSATVVNSSPWVSIRAGYRRDVNLRVVGSGGDGAIDPQFGHVGIQFY